MNQRPKSRSPKRELNERIRIYAVDEHVPESTPLFRSFVAAFVAFVVFVDIAPMSVYASRTAFLASFIGFSSRGYARWRSARLHPDRGED